jgi:hypothetical protein
MRDPLAAATIQILGSIGSPDGEDDCTASPQRRTNGLFEPIQLAAR